MAVPLRKRGISVEFQPMSPEQVERTLQFLLQTHAKFEANFARVSQKTETDFARLSEKTDRIAEGVIGVTVLANQTERKVRELADSVGTVRDGVNALTGIVGRMSERIEKLGERVDERLDRLEKSQERTDQQIKGLATLFERHLREDHGRGQS